MPRNRNEEPDFKTVFYKEVELFLHRDMTQKPTRLRLYDALSGLFVASELSKAETDQFGLPHPVRGKNEEELLLILEQRVKAVSKNGESLKDVITRSRHNLPPGEKQEILLKAYREAIRANSGNDSVKVESVSTNAPLVKVINPVAVTSSQTKKEPVKMQETQDSRRTKLVLYGSKPVERIAVARTATPTPTPTWTPIPHLTLVETVEDALRSTGLQIGEQVHSLDQDGARYFGLLEIKGQNKAKDYTWVLGLRNSHDKTFPAQICCGATVMVCSNLSFSGEVRLSRKHSVHLQRDLPQLAARAVGQLMEAWNRQDQRIDAYKNHVLRPKSAHDIVIRLADVRAITNRMIPSVLKEWREPRHPEFENRTAWSLFNSATEILKSGNLDDLPKRTQALHALFDTQVKLAPVHLN